jgi:hypothetical protein
VPTGSPWAAVIPPASRPCTNKLHVLDVPDEVCLARLQARNAEGRHEYRVSHVEFEELSRYFEPPTPTEGLDIVLHRTR